MANPLINSGDAVLVVYFCFAHGSHGSHGSLPAAVLDYDS